MDDSFGIGFCLAGVIAVAMVLLLVVPSVEGTIMKQAFERGYAVQCLGQTGYHWECEGE